MSASGSHVRVDCPGKDNKGCGVSFLVRHTAKAAAERRGVALLCPGCHGWVGKTKAQPEFVIKDDSPHRGVTVLKEVRRMSAAYPHGVPLAELALAAWRADNASFGLAGYEDRHPNVKTIELTLVYLCAAVGRGLTGTLHRPRASHYQLTAYGEMRLDAALARLKAAAEM